VTPAFGQGDAERAGARAVALQGVQAFNESRWKDSVDLFTRAESLVHSPIHLLYMARAHEKLGQLVQAYEAYRKIVREKLPADASAAMRNAQTDAQKELPQLEPRLPYVNVVVEGGPPGAAVNVTMDGVAVPPALVGVSRPADPGEHKFQATAEGLQSDVVTLMLKEGSKESIVLKLQPVAGQTPSGPVADPGAGSAGGQVTLGPAATPSEDGMSKAKKLRIGSYVAFGVGAVGVGAGTFFLISGLGKRGDADDLCSVSGGNCPLEKKSEVDSLDSDANSALTLSLVGYGVGVAGVATGVVLYMMSKKQEAATADTGIKPWVAGNMLGVQGKF
jgi:hypothetical protein